MPHMKPVAWTRGVLLTPQHLQTQDRFLESQLRFQLSAVSFFPWGFDHLEIDQGALADGTLRVTAARGILQDGLLFDMPMEDALPPERVVKDSSWAPDQNTLQVYLAIPEIRIGSRNVATADTDGSLRFRAETIDRRDEITGGSERPITVATKNFRLLTENDSLDGNALLPLARMVRTGADEYELDSRFVPPVVSIGASQRLLSITRGLVDALTDRNRTLGEMRRRLNRGLADFGHSNVQHFWMLYTVNSYLPEIRHLYETRTVHPGRLFAAMSALAGALTTFSSTVAPSDLPSYNHSSLSEAFEDLAAQTRALLDAALPTRFVTLAMRPTEPSVYATAVDNRHLIPEAELYLALLLRTTNADLIDEVPRLVKVSSEKRMGDLVKHSLKGVPLSLVRNPPSALPVRPGYHYFRLDRAVDEWDEVVAGRSVAAYVPANLPDPAAELLVLLPDSD